MKVARFHVIWRDISSVILLALIVSNYGVLPYLGKPVPDLGQALPLFCLLGLHNILRHREDKIKPPAPPDSAP